MTEEILEELRFPRRWKKLYNRIQLLFMRYGEEALRDCEATCYEHNKNVVTCWNLFNAAVAAYNLGEIKKAEVMFNHCDYQLQLIYKDVDIFNDNIIDMNGSYIGVIQDPEEWGEIMNDTYKIEDFEKGKVVKKLLDDNSKLCVITTISDLGVLDFSVEHPVERRVAEFDGVIWYVYISKNTYNDGMHHFKFVSNDYSNN